MHRNKKLGIYILPSILCVLAMLVAACGSNGSGTSATTTTSKPAAASADKQVFRYPIGDTDFGTLDPALVQNSTDSQAIQTMFTGLVQFKDDGTVVDQLAASHKLSADGLTYTFTMKPNLKFSDGAPLTSKDVAYSINRSLDPALKSPVSYYLALLKDYDAFQNGKVKTLIGDSIVTPDDNTIALTISKPAAYFLQALTYPISYAVEKSLIDKYGDSKWTDHLNEGGGDGPFKASSYVHTQGLDVVPNANYYGAKPQLQKIQFLISGDTATETKSYLSGQ
ncbi:MAG TPA: ABC transporter substrate-binding protein, partial [Ktedonosporobacter sp.]|nr:ABC transporter substrate-binding protein [Ktedonosporobacter sp.]